MDFSQVETQKGVVELNTFSVLSLMDDLQRLFSASLNRPNVQFSAEIDLKLPGQEVEKQSEASSLVDSDKTDETVVGKGDKDTTAEAQELTDNDSASKAPDESSQKPLKDLVLVGDDGKLRRILINMLTNVWSVRPSKETVTDKG